MSHSRAYYVTRSVVRAVVWTALGLAAAWLLRAAVIILYVDFTVQ